MIAAMIDAISPIKSDFYTGVLSILDTLIVAQVLEENFFYCFVSFFSFYIQSYSGALLTLIIATVRIVLTKKSARNVLISNKTILKRSMAAYISLMLAFLAYVTLNTINDVPFALYIEVCYAKVGDPRPVPKPAIMILQVPNLFNLISLLVDLSLLKFLKSVVQSSVNVLKIEQSLEFHDNNDDNIFKSKTEPSSPYISLLNPRPLPIYKSIKNIGQYEYKAA